MCAGIAGLQLTIIITKELNLPCSAMHIVSLVVHILRVLSLPDGSKALLLHDLPTFGDRDSADFLGAHGYLEE